MRWLDMARALLLTPTVGLLASCGSSGGGVHVESSASAPQDAPPAVLEAKQDATPVNPALVTADNAFGLDLLRVLGQSAAGNVAVSPLSAALVLQILYDAAGDDVQSVMSAGMHLGGMTAPQLNGANAALQAALLDADPKIQLSIANSLWTHAGDASISPLFVQTVQQYYGATLGDLSGAPADINAWVAQATQGLITDLLPAMDYSRVQLVAANALYFKGQWTTQFDPKATQPAPFTLADGSIVTVATMHADSYRFGHLRGPNFNMLRIPYASGRMSMLLLQPDAGIDLRQFIATMTDDDWSRWIGQLSDRQSPLWLPKFTAKFAADLTSVLPALGMADLCFAALSHSCLTQLKHATVIEVDEMGTVAAAATGGATTTVVDEGVRIDTPFLYAIRDDLTGATLFAGLMFNPT